MNTNRLPAEWELQSFIQFTFPSPTSDWHYIYEEAVRCFVDIIYTTAQFVPVMVVCNNTYEVASFFQNTSKYPIKLVEIPSEDTWARDHGPISIEHDQQPVLLDFIFNGWGNKFKAFLDNQITSKLHQLGVFGELALHPVPFVLEGGSIESNGKGLLLTTSECLLSPTRNVNFTKDQIEKQFYNLLGIKKVLWLDHGYLAGDDTDSHIDTLARLCPENVIMYVKCMDKLDEHYEALYKMEQQLTKFTNLMGQPFHLVPLPMPEACYEDDGHRLPATYANFLFVNGGVLVPLYQVPQDEEALAIFRKQFPDRKIVGVNCRTLIRQHGSLHCISMQYPQKVPLFSLE